MSKYTTQVRWIIEQATPDYDGSYSGRLEKAAPLIFNFYFPIWAEEYRTTLETKILRHYFNMEIGLETVGLWKFYMETRLNEIMPYYNQLYKTIVVDYDYMADTNIVEDFTGDETRSETAKYSSNQTNDTDTTDDTNANTTVNGEVDTTDTSNGTNHTAHSDFPQAPLGQTDYASYEDYTQIQNTDTGKQTTLNDTDLTSKRVTTTNQETDFSSNNNVNANKGNVNKTHRYGTSGSKSFTELINQYRESLMNIDMLIIKDLSDLFMNIY